jgi:hypothetical protein
MPDASCQEESEVVVKEKVVSGEKDLVAGEVASRWERSWQLER